MHRTIRIGLLALLAAATVFSVLVWLGPLRPVTRHVAMPPDDATPAQVVRTWAQAVDGHDCRTANALWTSDRHPGDVDWCGQLRSLRIDTGPTPVDGGATYDLDAQVDFHWLWIYSGDTGDEWAKHALFQLRRNQSGAWRLAYFGPCC